jgi:hypothetical protein
MPLKYGATARSVRLPESISRSKSSPPVAISMKIHEEARTW